MPSLKQLLFPHHTEAKFRRLQKSFESYAYDQKFDWDNKAINYNRIALTNLLVSKFENCSYLEIGCNTNVLFDSLPISNKTGVDPFIGGNVRLTSDDFFLSNKNKFDVIFIDGLHTYEQVRRDIVNSMKVLKPGGWIAIDDMLPRNWIEQHVPCISPNNWTGDVWKVAFELINTAGIDFKIFKIDLGVGAFRVNGNDVKLANLENFLSDKKFSYLYENISMLPITDWHHGQDWLRN